MGLISFTLASTTVASTYLSAPALLSIIGFTKGGIVAGVASGSLVSILQSAGTARACIGGPIGAAVAVGVAGVVGTAAFVLI